jgi:hypothetical protein
VTTVAAVADDNVDVVINGTTGNAAAYVVGLTVPDGGAEVVVTASFYWTYNGQSPSANPGTFVVGTFNFGTTLSSGDASLYVIPAGLADTANGVYTFERAYSAGAGLFQAYLDVSCFNTASSSPPPQCTLYSVMLKAEAIKR